MNKVKLNYNELFAKLYFIEQLKSNTDPATWDLEMNGESQKLKVIIRWREEKGVQGAQRE